MIQAMVSLLKKIAVICLMVLLTMGSHTVANSHDEEISFGARYSAFAEAKVASNELDSAVFYYLKAANGFESIDDFPSQAGVYNTLGNVFLGIADYEHALMHFVRAAEIYERNTNNLPAFNRPLANIAVIHNLLGNHDQALYYARKSRDIAKQAADTLVMSFTQRLLGRIYRGMGDTHAAINELQAVLPYYFHASDWSNLAETYTNLANIFYDMRSFDLARQQLDSALYYGELSGNYCEVAYVYNTLGFIERSVGNYAMAIQHFQYVLDGEGGNKGNAYLAMHAHKNISDMLFLIADWQGYARHMEQYLVLRDSLDLVKQASQSADVEARFQNSLKQRDIELLLLEQELLSADLLRQKTIRIIFTIAFFALAAMAFVLVNRFGALARTRQQLHVERLRNAIARDLHDDLGSTLSSIHILSSMAMRQEGADSRKQFSRISAHTAGMMDKLGDIVWSIHPNNDNLEQVLAKMREFASEILEPKGISFRFRVDRQVCSIRPDLEKRRNLFLIFKEAVNNAVKYSETERMHFILGLKGSRLEVVIRDFGKGFHPEQVRPDHGIGNMHSRAQTIGADFRLDSNPGEGTTISLLLPIT